MASARIRETPQVLKEAQADANSRARKITDTTCVADAKRLRKPSSMPRPHATHRVADCSAYRSRDISMATVSTCGLSQSELAYCAHYGLVYATTTIESGILGSLGFLLATTEAVQRLSFGSRRTKGH
jgi:hypothetical protein